MLKQKQKLILRLRSRQTGFSLVETIIYLAIVSILLVAVLNFHFSLSGTSAKLWAKINVSENRRFVLQTIDYLSRNASGFLKDVNGDCTTSSTLAFYFDDDTYLPGTCVENGGGVKITSASNRVKLTCYPNITHNGQYNACNATAGNSYWLSSPAVSLAGQGLFFATTTATSTSGIFTNVEANLTLINISNNQTELLATSTATSTITLKNQQPDNLLAWWRMDDASPTTITDSQGSFSGSCSPAPSSVAGLVNGSSAAFDYELAEEDACDMGNADGLNINDSFTLTAWVKPESFVNANSIIHKHSWSNLTGYVMWLQSGKLYCRVCDGFGCTGPSETNSTLLVDHTYHVACTFDKYTKVIKMYVYEEGVGGLGTTTSQTAREALVNYDTYMKIGAAADVTGNWFDGVIDEARIYGRLLSDQEVWALQSQGASSNGS